MTEAGVMDLSYGMWPLGEGQYRWLTAPAPAAIAVLQMPVTALAAVFSRPVPLPGRCAWGLLRASASAVDEVVVWRLSDDLAELGCHGGPGVRQAVDQLLQGQGLQLATPMTTATPLATSAPQTAAAVVTDQWQALAMAPCAAAVEWLLAGRADEIPPQWLQRCPVVLLTGPSNAGKSTLLNAWCGHQRALVSTTAGTTRDLIAAEVVVAGWRLRVIDSAGMRATPDPLEQAGQDLATQARDWADVVCWLQPDDMLPDHVEADLIIAGKHDLRPVLPSWGLPWAAPNNTGEVDSAGYLRQLEAAVLGCLGLPGAGPSENSGR